MQCFLSLLYEKIFTKFAQMTSKALFRFSSRRQLMLLLILAVGLNLNTLFNQYVLDDGVVFTANSLVEKGIKAIPEILTTDLFHGFKGENNALSEGRYRPFTLVVNAIEYQFFGANPFVSHLINLLFFILLLIFLFKVLNNYVFVNHPKYLAFVTCLLFVVHPIHTEVIANVKSRDEIITFLFLTISLLYIIKHTIQQKTLYLVIAFICFFLAILTRESAITFIAIVPLFLYFFFGKTLKQTIFYAIPLVLLTGAYIYIRHVIVGSTHAVSQLDVLNAPFLLASHEQALATQIYILLRYLALLVFPHPLSFDYGYNQIPYITFASWQFILSILICLSLMVFAIFSIKSKSLLSFCVLHFFINISLVSNILVDVGTPLSERFLFQPSLAFCIAVGYFYLKLYNKIPLLVNTILLTVIILFSIKTIHRNTCWKTNVTLVNADVITSPNSYRTTLYALEIYILLANESKDIEVKKENLKKAVQYGEQCNRIFSASPRTHTDLLIAYHDLFACYSSLETFLKNNNLDPSSPDVNKTFKDLSEDFYKQGNGFAEQNNPAGAVQAYLKCLQLNNKHVEAWYNLGGNYYLLKDSVKASNAWDSVKKLSPEHLFNKDDFYAN